MEVKIKTLFTDSDLNVCTASREIFDTLHLFENTIYNIHLGQLSQSTFIKSNNSMDKCIYLPKSISTALMLNNDIVLNIWKDDNDIYIGPVVGIFVNTKYLNTIQKGNPPIIAQKHSQAGFAANCLVYYFSINQIIWSEKKIKGCTFVPELNKYGRRDGSEVIYF